ncbi:peptidase S1 and S6, chymotrypsin/Hap [Trichodesmium erythraeum IMS101]|uniref:Peptidase S1 and S6, chymotrypsin/Hap n=1 Tax=Trichodesmium erythraeum (strain IMS101) TaxID=203124 RepID=Q10UW0_TRIEI|nr:trypsin-like peptidase domain-containing protein [Trichodesmium erythraeum GBRTRLIN201]MCH2047315.1 trypsin-like peptidase domain-containing protein [Trichodesmium sp. ALOHA_ZT_67]MDE5093120.1 trypsin-like peptidase domain-containing protein [Trichodesmium sp. St11_bin5]MDT9339100.1 trypsin-like peptidase domain-containing protein [Trichodesmium erythraeum 21-75]
MKNTMGKVFWKQPLTYLLLLAGAVGALLGERLILQTSSSPENSSQLTELSVTQSLSKTDNTSNSEKSTWLPVRAPISNSNFIVNAVQKVGPAVVRINASRAVSQRPNMYGFRVPEDFYGFELPRSRNSPIEQGTGSGFIISSDGNILTNAHVVEGSTTVEVVLKDGRRLQGKVLGTDSLTDVAVVKIDAGSLPTVKIGDSNNLQPGEWAIAIGNPLGLDNSVTVGIISATGRSSNDVGVPDKRVGFIQTDAAINPGNSGGPLLNQNGEVIGINTAIIDGAQGLGFAIPINNAQQIAKQLIKVGKAEHAYLGIAMQTLTPELKQELNRNFNTNMFSDQGVLVIQVVPGSPADKSGLKPGDIIQRIDNQTITTSENVQQIVQNKTVGSLLELEINRNGKSLNLDVRTGNLPPRRFRG